MPVPLRPPAVAGFTIFTLLLASFAPAAADLPSPPQLLTQANAELHQAIGQTSSGSVTRSCSASPALRIATYSAQAVDGLVSGAAVRHGATGRALFGTASAATYLASEAAFDLVVGAFTRRASCGTKNAVTAVAGASAVLDATQAGTPR
ncbi:MAG TPA: hypothetical protein VHT05_10785 [Candidatus Elarobacter sp.]|nr:hypothetical protein [Candidatus Elarobacter sp.]